MMPSDAGGSCSSSAGSCSAGWDCGALAACLAEGEGRRMGMLEREPDDDLWSTLGDLSSGIDVENSEEEGVDADGGRSGIVTLPWSCCCSGLGLTMLRLEGDVEEGCWWSDHVEPAEEGKFETGGMGFGKAL